MIKNRLLKIAMLWSFITINLTAYAQKENNKLEILSFDTERFEDKVDIKWTINEANLTGYFELERSFNGRDFKTIMYILGPDPSKIEGNQFGGFDKIASKKTLFYRLKQVRDGGKIELSDVKEVSFTE
ncbi:MAG: hypothetical protein ABIN48_09505 [Ginsengibacter sp.]